MDKLLLKPSQVATLLGIGRTRIYRLISDGQIPSFKIGSTLHVSAESLQAWVAKQEQTTREANQQQG